MPTITLSTKYLARLTGTGISLEKLSEQITKLGPEIEHMDEKEISLEITPNRPDLYSAVGLARAIRNFMHRSKKFRYKIEPREPVTEVVVGREAKAVRPFISAFIATGLSLSDDALADVIHFTDKLCDTHGRDRKKIAIGLHDLDSLEPPFHYNAYKDERFMPLNSDKELNFSDILKSHEKGLRYGYTISGKGLYPAIKDEKGTMALIPIINSQRTRVTTKTKKLFVDITGTSEFLVNKAADVLACMLMDLNAEIERVRIKYPGREVISPTMENGYITLTLLKAESEIGVAIGMSNMLSLANKMGYESANVKGSVRLTIPEYRLDIINEQDVIEDIAIAYGYDYIAPLPIFAAQQGKFEEKEMLFSRISDAMLGIGYSEMMNSYLTNEKANFRDMRLNEGKERVTLKNPRARSITMMRTWILPSLLKNMGLSVHEKLPQRLYELDMAFLVSKGVPKEEHHLAAVSLDPKANFNYIKGVVESLATLMGLDYKISKYGHESFINGRCASISVSGKTVGFFGELHPEVLSNFGIEEPATAFEIDLSTLYQV